jgi:hypothetical protein
MGWYRIELTLRRWQVNCGDGILDTVSYVVKNWSAIPDSSTSTLGDRLLQELLFSYDRFPAHGNRERLLVHRETLCFAVLWLAWVLMHVMGS